VHTQEQSLVKLILS